MPLVLHKLDGSPASRPVLMTLEILGLQAQMVDVNTVAGENRKPEFVAKNPMHTIPFLEDGDFMLADSHAIIVYLVSKYGADKRQQLYPSDFDLRATIDQRMLFDASILFPKFRAIMSTILMEGGKGLTPQQIAEVEEAYGVLEIYLEKQPFVAHNHLTLADISVVSTVSSLNLFIPISENFPKLKDWFGRVKDREFYKKANEPGLNQLAGFLKTTTK